MSSSALIDRLRSTPFVAAALVLTLGWVMACSHDASPVAPSPGPSPLVAVTSGASSGILVGAGDIGHCGSPGSAATARLLDDIGGTIIALGDNAYFSGTAEEFANCYEPTWGRHRSRTRPVPGNHEYASGAVGYFAYFGERAGPHATGYYSYTVGPWRVIALNSEMPTGPESPQGRWLRGELGARRDACTAVYWHRPLFSSGRNGNNPDMRDLWRTLYEFDVDLVINGHDHTYERFAPQDPDGRLDPARGIRQFIVGTGGAQLYEFPRVQPNSEVRGAAWGVGIFTLTTGGYQWEFRPVAGTSFTDAGSGYCH
jgi:acid phosphatase type 7